MKLKNTEWRTDYKHGDSVYEYALVCQGRMIGYISHYESYPGNESHLVGYSLFETNDKPSEYDDDEIPPMMQWVERTITEEIISLLQW